MFTGTVYNYILYSYTSYLSKVFTLHPSYLQIKDLFTWEPTALPLQPTPSVAGVMPCRIQPPYLGRDKLQQEKPVETELPPGKLTVCY